VLRFVITKNTSHVVTKRAFSLKNVDSKARFGPFLSHFLLLVLFISLKKLILICLVHEMVTGWRINSEHRF